mgnify:CR=1 FL=1|tara:strand:+ start:731 stop:1201 length:471 start_codon:yes stop_codon:yes gene_type:complete
MKVFGIDAGQMGGLSIVSNEGGVIKLEAAIRMPVLQLRNKKIVDARAVVDFFSSHFIDAVIIEAVSAMPAQGVASSFQFGRSFGAVEALSYTIGTSVNYVTPAVWKRAMGLSKSKQQSLDLAEIKFGPNPLWGVKRNDGIAEAALLCLWFLDKHRN